MNSPMLVALRAVVQVSVVPANSNCMLFPSAQLNVLILAANVFLASFDPSHIRRIVSSGSPQVLEMEISLMSSSENEAQSTSDRRLRAADLRHAAGALLHLLVALGDLRLAVERHQRLQGAICLLLGVGGIERFRLERRRQLLVEPEADAVAASGHRDIAWLRIASEIQRRPW